MTNVLPRPVVMVPITININPVAWQEALDQAAVMGATHRLYGDPVETDERLWERVSSQYNATVRRRVLVDGKWVAPTPAWELLPDRPPVILFSEARQAYETDRADVLPLVDLDRLAALIREDGDETAYVEQTGGGCATIYVGPLWTDDQGDQRWTSAIGPGWFDEPGWKQGYASYHELWMSRDDDGVSPTVQVPVGATLREIADMVAVQVAAAKAQTALEVAARELKAKTLERRAGQASLRVDWQEQLTDEQAELLDGHAEAGLAAGDSDWRVSVTVYRVPREIVGGNQYAAGVLVLGGDDEVIVTPGTYVRSCAGKTVQAWRVGGVDDDGPALAYAEAVEALYQAQNN